MSRAAEIAEDVDAPPHDARAIANLLLDRADARGLSITNLALQKLLYFAHGASLVRRRRPLLTGHFVAWQFGPVHPTVYDAFKRAGDHPITFRATRRDLRARAEVPLPSPTDSEVVEQVEDVLRHLGRLPVGKLVELSHVKDGPWHAVVNEARTGIGLGLRIGDNVVLARFRHHWVPVGAEPEPGEPLEDAPLA